MEFGSIERELYVEASPEVVFEVVSRPEHLREWWADEATLDPAPGGTGQLTWQHDGGSTAVPMTVLEAVPPRLFSFRWAYEPHLVPDEFNSFHVTFELEPRGTGTTLRLTETGFRERGWEAAVLEATYTEHANAWDALLPRLAARAAVLVSTR
jgi:uncharacterized protein YndB with AHSA1/START domain